MAITRGFPTVIHLAANADFTNFAYIGVYAGANTTAIINGSSVTMVGSSKIDIKVGSISGANVYALGVPMNSATGLSYSSEPEEHLGGSTYMEQ